MDYAVHHEVIEPWIRAAWDARATDLHLTVDTPPRVRVDGLLHDLPGEAPLAAADTERILRGLLGPDRYAEFEEHRQVDFSFDWSGVTRFRGNGYFQRGSAALALRVIPYTIPTFEQLGLPPITRELMMLPHGLVLVTGPTGSGKSTTLASIIDAINERRPVHVLTVEDPIEYMHHHKRAMVNQREVGTDAVSFEQALRSALREDPDVLLVGEMRDLETIQIALTMAETGHLVFATLHTNNAAQTLDRIVDVFAGEEQRQIRVQLAGSLAAVVSQRLLPRIGGGRVAAFEVLVATHASRNIVRDGRTAQLRNVISTGAEHGMQTLEASLSSLVDAGLVAYDDAVAVSTNPTEVRAPQAARR